MPEGTSEDEGRGPLEAATEPPQFCVPEPAACDGWQPESSGRWLYPTWSDVPEEPPPGLQVFVEVFAGSAGTSKAVADLGIACLPPIELEEKGYNEHSTSVLDPMVARKFLAWARAGAIMCVHFGTPCTSYSAARKYDKKGPPPIRSLEYPEGLPDLQPWHQQKVDEGKSFTRLTAKWASAVAAAGAPGPSRILP